MIMVYQVILLLMTTVTIVTSQICPMAVCSCENGSGSGRIINCRDKGLSQIPDINASIEVFSELTFSTSQDPSSCSSCNQITSVSDGAFDGIQVKKLDLGKLSVSQFSDNAFRGLEQSLTELILYGDKTIPPPYTAIQNLSQLTSLHLENFDQNAIDSTNTFGNYPNLETLKLKNLKITYIEGSSFQNKLNRLTRLEIVGNPLMIVPVSALRELVTLEHLSLIQNQFTLIPSLAFQQLTNLIELDLQHNGISVLESQCFDNIQQKLEYLGLHLNNLNHTVLGPLIQGNWTSLQQLNLAHNRLTSLPNGLFTNMKQLAYLNLDTNHLSSLQNTAFQELRNMHELDFANNDITSIQPGTFMNLHQLRKLDITYQSEHIPNNRLSFTRESIQGLENNLVELRLTNTTLDENTAWNAIGSLVNLHILDISNTGLHSIKDFVFQNHNKLTHLYVRGAKNNITNINQKSFHGLKYSLSTIDLSNNVLQQIDKCVFQDFVKLADISLRSNPLHCDCDLLWLYDWIHDKINSNPNFFPFLVQAVCKSPSNLNNKELYTVNRNDLVCNDPNYVSPICTDYYATTTQSTTTSSTTTTPTPTPPVYNLILSISSSTADTVKISWSVDGDKSYISRYTVTYQKLGVTSSPKSISVDKAAFMFTFEGLDTGSQYEVCIYIIITNFQSSQPDGKCAVARTEETATKAPISTEDGLQPGVIAGIVIGIVLAVLIIIAFIYILVKTNQRRNKPSLPPPVVEARSFAPVGTPRTGYDSKRFSKPKKNVEQNGKDLQVNVITTGKMDDEKNRVSAGSYQFLNENQRLSQDPMPSSGKTAGANGTSHDIIPTRHSGGRYVNDLSSAPPPYSQHQYYVNDTTSKSQDQYVNNVDKRPLPKKPTSYENNSSGFLNHGFSPESYEDHQYHEIKDTMI